MAKQNEIPTKSSPMAPKEEKESVYSMEEYAAQSSLLDASPDLILAAFRYAGKRSATLKEAAAFVDKFKKMTP